MLWTISFLRHVDVQIETKSMSLPRVSIVIPCFNAEGYVRHAIESALGQGYENKEVILVDDGSTDGSLEVVKGFGNKIRWESGTNRGACAARNRGVEMASGDLIQFLDTDDLLHEGKLELQIREVLSSGADLVFCSGESEKRKGIEDGNLTRGYDGRDPVLYMLRGGLPTPAPIHWKKNLKAVGGFREHLPCSQERDLHLRLACKGLKFGYLAETLYTVRRVEGSVSSDIERILDQHLEIAWYAYRMLEEAGSLTEERRAAFAGFLAGDARVYLRQGLRDKAREYFEEARKMHTGGGLREAYKGPTRVLRRLLGARVTERFVGMKRWVADRSK